MVSQLLMFYISPFVHLLTKIFKFTVILSPKFLNFYFIFNIKYCLNCFKKRKDIFKENLKF